MNESEQQNVIMISSANCSELSVRTRRYRGVRSSKKTILYSDYNTEEETNNGNLNQRSISLTALPHNGSNLTAGTEIGNSPTTPVPPPGPLLEPRMAQLETLEAKMANIEVSLSTAQRRKNGKKNGSGSISNISKSSSIGTTMPSNILASIRSAALFDTCRELEALRNALKDKENTIQNLQGQINGCGRVTSLQPLDSSERRIAELRVQSLKQEEESKKSAIKKINLTLEQMDSNESNIDVRIKQAELEYELGREELGLLGIREELRALQARLDAKPNLTLYSSINSSGKYTLYCVHLEYDPKSPRFGAGSSDEKNGLFVLWAADNSGLQKGDRILEINGKLTLSTSKEEMIRLLSVCPSRAEIVVLRLWIPPPSREDFLRRENLRLTHRISYLEDQVSELMLAVSSSKEIKSDDEKTEVFQKGCHVTLLPGNPKNGFRTNVVSNFNSIIKVSEDSNTLLDKSRQSVELAANGVLISVNGCNVPLGPFQKYDSEKDKIGDVNKKYENLKFASPPRREKSTRNCENDEEQQSQCLNKVFNTKNASENLYSLSDLERPNRKTGHFPTSRPPLDYMSESNYHKYKTRRGKKFDTDEESIFNRKFGQSEPETGRLSNKPAPPKKPSRLSINRATSLQSVDTDYGIQNTVRKIKRSHKGEAPPPPIFQENKINASQYLPKSNSNIYKNESWIYNHGSIL